MRVLLRLWAMCLRLLLTSPFYWTPMLVALWIWRMQVLSEWVWTGASAMAAVLALSCAMFLESGGGLLERVRMAQAGRLVLAAALAAVLTVSATMWMVGVTVLR